MEKSFPIIEELMLESGIIERDYLVLDPTQCLSVAKKKEERRWNDER